MESILYYQILIVYFAGILTMGNSMGNAGEDIVKTRMCFMLQGYDTLPADGQQAPGEDAGGDIMGKYNVFTDDWGYSVIVESKNNPDEFQFHEFINGTIEDYALCTIDGTKAETEEEAYLYVDLGAQGEWWADPFSNLQTDLVVENECIPDGLLEEMEKNAEGLLFSDAVRQRVEIAGAKELTEEEIKQKAPEIYAALYCEDAVFQNYYEVDFDNDKLPDLMVVNRLGMGKMGHEETYFYKKEADGEYRKTFESCTSSCYNQILRYDGKNYYILIYYDTDGSLQRNYGYDYYYCELYDFQNGRPEEMVRLTPKVLEEDSRKEDGPKEDDQKEDDQKVEGQKEDSQKTDNSTEGPAEEQKLSVSVKRRFVNDFINQSLGAH